MNHENQEQSIVSKFRLGAKVKCAQKVWKQIEQEVDEKSESKLATTLKVTSQHVYVLRRGRMSMDMFVALLSEMGWGYDDLEPLPTLRERAVSGYQWAIHYAKGSAEEPALTEMITEESLISAIFLVRSPLYKRLRAKCDLDDGAWEEVAAEVLPEVATALGVDVGKLICNTGPALRKVRDDWAKSVIECMDALPYRWLRGISA